MIRPAKSLRLRCITESLRSKKAAGRRFRWFFLVMTMTLDKVESDMDFSCCISFHMTKVIIDRIVLAFVKKKQQTTDTELEMKVRATVRYKEWTECFKEPHKDTTRESGLESLVTFVSLFCKWELVYTLASLSYLIHVLFSILGVLSSKPKTKQSRRIYIK